LLKEEIVRNAEVSKARILDAALDEFSAHGVAGARMDRIAAKANCNKNLIYIYFHNKEQLFTRVLQENLARIYEALPFTPDDLPGFAARAFDYAMAHPMFMRLLAWFGLEQSVTSPPERVENWERRVSALRAAQESGQLGTAFEPGFVLTATLSLVTAYTAVNPFGPSLNQQAIERPEELRGAITEAVSLIASARKESQ
jgi:AcrR family transcriptional regulator